MTRVITLSALQPPFASAATPAEIRAARLRLMRDYFAIAAQRGSHVALLPEQFNTFGLPPAVPVVDAAEPTTGETVGEARRLARELATAVVLPIDAVDEGRFWNCAV